MQAGILPSHSVQCVSWPFKDFLLLFKKDCAAEWLTAAAPANHESPCVLFVSQVFSFIRSPSLIHTSTLLSALWLCCLTLFYVADRNTFLDILQIEEKDLKYAFFPFSFHVSNQIIRTIKEIRQLEGRKTRQQLNIWWMLAVKRDPYDPYESLVFGLLVAENLFLKQNTECIPQLLRGENKLIQFTAIKRAGRKKMVSEMMGCVSFSAEECFRVRVWLCHSRNASPAGSCLVSPLLCLCVLRSLLLPDLVNVFYLKIVLRQPQV